MLLSAADGLAGRATVRVVPETGRHSTADRRHLIEGIPAIGVDPVRGQVSIVVVGESRSVKSGDLVVGIEQLPNIPASA
jgi:hypothetical protein